jgi:acetyltransferase
MAACARAEPAARLKGVLVQQMVPPGVELILGCSNDPTYGPVIALGVGGIFAEFVGKPVLRLPPLASDGALAMIEALPNRSMLDGVRGLPPVDLARLVDTVVRFSWLVADLADVIGEIDVNPLIAGTGGVVAADALVVLKVPT